MVDHTGALNAQPRNYTRTCERTEKLVKTKSANRIPRREILPKATREASRVQTAGLILLIEWIISRKQAMKPKSTVV